MVFIFTCLALCPFSLCRAAYQTSSLPPDLTVRATTGIYTALLEDSFSNVRQFRNIPYALSPTGSCCWLPPVAVPPSSQHHYAHTFPPSCPQYLPAPLSPALTRSHPLSVWNTNLSDFSISLAGQSPDAGTFAQTTAEDCLSLAIWAPRNTTTNTTTSQAPRDPLPPRRELPARRRGSTLPNAGQVGAARAAGATSP